MFLIVISQPFRKYVCFLNITCILKVITVFMGSTYYGTPCINPLPSGNLAKLNSLFDIHLKPLIGKS